MLSTSSSVVLNLEDATPSGMVIGVSVSSLGGDGFDQPSDHNNGGNGGAGGSTTLQNSSAVTITGGTLNSGVVGALVESRGGKGGRDNTAVVDYYGGSGGQTLNSGSAQYGVEMDNYADVSLGSAPTYLQGGTRAWGVAAQSVGGDAGLFDSKGNESPIPYGVGGNASGVDFLSSGNVDVFLTSTSDVPDGVVGLLARSIGGQGGGSNWKGDDGGKGGDAGVVTLNAGQAELSAVTTINVGVNEAVSGTSAGILAQSIGGNGGEQYSTNAYGGNGGNAGPVAVELYWVDLTATGDKVAGVTAYSLGGNGGSDSMDSYRDSGGNGGTSGTVAVTLNGKSSQEQTSISTSGSEAIGVSAQSIGGYGGSAVKQAGVGQNGGAAQITADVNSQVSTLGSNSMGMLAQSIGGGGGTGEDFTSSLPGGSGKGGNGGNGASATIASSATIKTQGQYGHGMVAQSIGGSGGAGAVADSIVSLGGAGGAGGAGGSVTITGASSVSTSGDSAIGVIAQSIGGGGGTAGSASGLFSIGGSVNNSGNNNAGTVTVTVDSVDTTGDGSIGILAQSVGGSGGSGGSAVGITSVGGSGSSGGSGGEVTVNVGANISTQGKYALGLVAQSVGGGGGNGGDSFAISTAVPGIAIGGRAGAASSSNKVTVQNLANGPASTITTQGDGATGILAQSIGGGGGNGGSSQQDSFEDLVSVSIGGAAGGGGNAAEVDINLNELTVTTSGISAAGLVAHSIGGGGGNGGAAHGFDMNVGVSLAVAVGGTGGAGGNGSEVSIDLDNVTISTAGVGTSGVNASVNGQSVAGSDSYGILAQSIGGGGGNGGSSAASTVPIGVTIPETDISFAVSSSTSVGGSGGVAGNGGELDIQLKDNTAIYTGGQGSHGLLAQSIGGGGGNGGASKAMSTDIATSSESVSANVNVGVGGSGQAGGTGGVINLSMGSAATITTYDDLSNGLMGQSIGGGGGNAGVGSSKSGGISQGVNFKADVGVGGKDGAGGSGGVITATLQDGSVIKTYGSGSRGLLLQSLGGGGGAAQGTTVDLGGSLSTSGGSDAVEDEPDSGGVKLTAAVSVSVGGNGAVGGDGGAVTVTGNGSISTIGADADGILIQSIGGGGGLAGNAGADASGGPSSYADPSGGGGDEPSGGDDPSSGDDPPKPEATDLGNYSLSVAVGGQGGAGGEGGAVVLNYSGATTTQGDFSDAMVIQSIGGGGGTGGASTAKGAKGSSQGVVAVGGSGGAAGNGGTLTLNITSDPANHQGTLATSGDVSYGLLAQSIGGGGGQGAIASDIVTKSTVENPSIVVGWGGSGGNGGNGGTINMNAPNSGVSVATSGYDSHGIVLQSIGGGGGTAAMGGASLSGTTSNPQLSLQLGGGGREGSSSGGDISVNAWVKSLTAGDHAFGFVAQSIGGGGGIASAGPGANIQSVNLAAPFTGDSLHGGNLSIEFGTNSTNSDASFISTNGRGSHGVVLQSIAGGGGIGGDTANGPLALGWADGVVSPSSGQVSGDISFTLGGGGGGGGGIYTTGDGAHGVIAQSLSAPGGLGGNSKGSFAGTLAQLNDGAGGISGGITLTLNSNVNVQGENAWGVFAQTYDTQSATPKPVNITVSGDVAGGASASSPATGGAIWIDSPAASTVTVSTGGTVNGALGHAAIQQTGKGSTTVMNSGALMGNLLGAASSTTSATLTSSATSTAPILLSNFGTFSNADLVQGHIVNQGQMFIGKTADSDTMHITGNFTQGSQGVLHLATDFVSQSTDLLKVDGHAKLSGQIKVVASTLMPNRELTFLQAASIVPNAALKGESDLFTYRSRQVGNTFAVSADRARFNETSATHGVADNLQAVGSHLQQVWDRGSKPELGKLYAALNRSALEAEGYTNALNDLSPGVLAAPAALKQASMVSFSNSLMSCPAFEGTSTQMGERDCVWGRITGNTTRLDDSLGTSGLKSEGVMYQIGTQRSIAPSWFLGVAGAYENKTMRADDGRQRVEGDSGYLGVSLKYENGPWTFAGALTGSYGSFDNTRRIALMGAQAKSDSKIISFGQRLRAAYTYTMPQSYIKPFIDLDIVHTRMPSFDERNAGALNLHLEGVNKWSAVISPSVEVGGRFDLNSGYTVRPYASVGVSFSSTDKWESQARLASAPSGTDPFRSTLETGRVFGRVSTGVQVLSNKGMDVSLQYDGLLSSKVNSHSGSLKATWSF
ncbi:autotransporter outer membrane beta-barrel domain-containing protein [Alcaligenaceae bacterium]|nr:autotransporter outer membrane beta-barrel domain-containing protein [Alcaligenaceae bacterium]